MADTKALPTATDITVEQYRTYVYADGGKYKIENPKQLFILESGAHRVVDSFGVTHAPARPWLAIQFKQNNGKPFSF